jgi:Ca-activated chloride channel homolog
MALDTPIRTPRSMRDIALPASRRVTVHRLRPGGWLSAVVLLLAALLPASASAQGWIEPLRPDVGWGVERTASEVRVTVDGRVARVEVTEWFRNGSGGIAEGHYLYPLPGEASFSSFSLFQGEDELTGETLDAGEARRIYEGIVARLQDPALIEMAGQGLLRARVFPIQPGETRKVVLRYEQLLAGSGGGLRFSYVGGSPALARPIAGPGINPEILPQPRPEPRPGPPFRPWREGALFQQEGAGGSMPPIAGGSPTGLPFQLVVTDAGDFLEPFSPTHRVAVERVRGRLQVRSDEVLEGAFTLFLPFSRERIGMSLTTHRLSGEEGWVMLALSPGAADLEDPEPRDLTVVLDISGSMSGAKMEQARAALQQLLGTLDTRDRFRLVVYNAAVRSFRDEWSPARGAPLSEARRWVDAIGATGGTNIAGALEEAFRLQSPRGRLPIVVFLTDGLPTVGEQDPDRIATAAEAARGRARVFAFGVGYDVNTRLLDAVAAAGRGTTAYVQPDESVETALGTLAEKIRHPVLTDLELVDTPVRIHELYPVTIPDLFAGEELVLLARYTPGRRDVTGDVVLRGMRGGRIETFRVRATFPVEATGDAWLPRLWASRKLGHLSRQVRIEGETESLVEEIRSLALRYGLVSEYTSYLVVEPGMALADAGPMPVPGRRGIGEARMLPAPMAAPPTSGAVAVQAAEASRMRREVNSAADLREAEETMARWNVGAASGGARMVGGRTFQLVEGTWRDAGIQGDAPVVKVAPYSQGWFRLLEALPELRQPATELETVALGGARITVELVNGGEETLPPARIREIVEAFRGN